MKRLSIFACAALLALVAVIGCGKPAPTPAPAPTPETTGAPAAPAAGDVTWKCSHEGCPKTQTTAADAAAPSC